MPLNTSSPVFFPPPQHFSWPCCSFYFLFPWLWMFLGPGSRKASDLLLNCTWSLSVYEPGFSRHRGAAGRLQSSSDCRDSPLSSIAVSGRADSGNPYGGSKSTPEMDLAYEQLHRACPKDSLFPTTETHAHSCSYHLFHNIWDRVIA